MPRRWIGACLVLAVVPGLNRSSTQADEPPSAVRAEQLLARQLAPLLKARCLSCHGDGPKLEGKLDLRTRASMVQGGVSGDALVPGKPALSLIYRAVRYDDEIRMPPPPQASQRFNEVQQKWLHDWIAAAAPWPKDLDMAKVKPAAKAEPAEDPTNPGSRLPDYTVAPPDYQYKFGDILIPAARADEPTLKTWSAAKAAQYLDDGALAWTRQRQCVACHTNGAYLMARPALTPFFGPPLAEVRKPFVLGPRTPHLPQPQRPGAAGPLPHLQIACALAEWDAHVTQKLSKETDHALLLLCDALAEDGTWKIHPLRWIPYILNEYHNACMFAKAIGTAPGWLDQVQANGDKATLAALERLRQHLRTGQPQNDYDRVYLLWAELRWPGLIDAERRQELISMIRRHQRPDGGWSLRSFGTPQSWGNGNRAAKLGREAYGVDPPSDAHMTGVALIVLREGGIAVADPDIQRGVAWLKANQRESGRWWVRSLNTDYWQFSTYHGTAQALLALGMCGEIPRRQP